MQVESQIEKIDVERLRGIVARTLMPAWFWPSILVVVVALPVLLLDAGLRHSSTALLAGLIYAEFLAVGPLAAERGLSEEIRHPYAPIVVYAVIVGVIGLVYALHLAHGRDLLWVSAVIGLVAVHVGFDIGNRRRRSRLLGPIALATDAAGVHISRRGESVLLPWDQLIYRELEGSFVFGIEAPRRWFIFPKHNQSSQWAWDLSHELGSHVQPVSDWPWARPWGV